MSRPQARAAVLWTGGKDSSLALHEAVHGGCRITHLVTSAPEQAAFRAHPLHAVRRQADALGLPHRTVTVREPFEQAYERAFRELRDRDGITALVMGDLAEVDGSPNWVVERSRASDVEVLRPLWGRPRLEVLQQLVTDGFEVIVSCVNEPWLTREWVGRTLDGAAIEELRVLGQRTGFDLCGEHGEYHTLVLDGPLFRRRLALNRTSVTWQDPLHYLEILSLSLVVKDQPAVC